MSMGGDPMQALQMLRRRGGGWGGANGYPQSRDASNFNTNPPPDPYAGVHHPGDPNLGGDAPPMPNGPGDVNPGPMPTNPGGGYNSSPTSNMGLIGDTPPTPNSGPGDANPGGQPPANPVLMQLLQNLGKGGPALSGNSGSNGGYGAPPMKPQTITPPSSMQSTLPAVSAIDSPVSNAPGPAEKGGPDNGLPSVPPANPAASTANRIPSRPMNKLRQLQASPY